MAVLLFSVGASGCATSYKSVGELSWQETWFQKSVQPLAYAPVSTARITHETSARLSSDGYIHIGRITDYDAIRNCAQRGVGGSWDCRDRPAGTARSKEARLQDVVAKAAANGGQLVRITRIDEKPVKAELDLGTECVERARTHKYTVQGVSRVDVYDVSCYDRRDVKGYAERLEIVAEVYRHDPALAAQYRQHGAMHAAIRAGDLARVKALIAAGLDPNKGLEQDKDGQMGRESEWVVEAAKTTHAQVVDYLISVNADPRVAAYKVLKRATNSWDDRYTEVARTAIRRGAYVDEDHLGLITIGPTNHKWPRQMVLLLLQAGAKPQPGNTDAAGIFATALYRAAERGDMEVLRALLRAGTNPNVQPGRSYKHDYPPEAQIPALHWAVHRGHVEVVRALLDHKANVNLAAFWPGAKKGDAEFNQQFFPLAVARRQSSRATNASQKTGYKQIETMLVAAGARER